jgi:aminocarboxymuconate-semialdehyde decarboxylase
MKNSQQTASPLPKALRLDIHTHILPRRLPDLSQKYGYAGWLSTRENPDGSQTLLRDGAPFRDIQCNCWDADTRLKDCGVNVQVLSTIPVLFNYWAKPQHCLDLATYLNDDIAHTCSLYPDNFIGLAVKFT